MASTRKSISRFFSESLGAPLLNPRWSWGAISPTTGQLFLRVWKDERETLRGKDVIAVLGANWQSNSVGLPERREHVRLLKVGIEAYGVLCTVKDASAVGPRKIQSFDQETLLRFGPVDELEGNTYVSILGAIPLADIEQRWRGPKSLLPDLAAIWADASAPTTKERLAQARVGQGQFRSRVFRLWGDRCSVTGSGTLDAVRASHIKPWSRCDDRERLDPNNGLPLIATLDALFDAGLISFDATGQLLVASVLAQSERLLLGLGGGIKLSATPSSRTEKYLAYHRVEVFLG
jgi:hypothetical protein